ncbi:MAG: DegT/DnrJ/EryC1/StrS aminotransferase family protein [Alphaproteobacteria bacterium]|nr:DegT/DnrJ/EryC1/StrS aminotransferase family protein [Alphaproteobacteria bacterium]
MLNTPFSPWPSFTEEEADAVRRVLLSNKVNYWTGEEGRAFEKEFAAWAGTSHAAALSNGTVALEAALNVLDIGPGDEVIVTPRTFLASASCIAMRGAAPVFADVDADSQNITADTIAAVLTERTRAIICVHLAGWPCDMDPIMALAREKKLFVIEDCAQAHGARYKGRSVGSIGDIGAWSFCQDKIITTGGEGGMVTTNDPELFDRLWSYKDHGKSRQKTNETASAPGFRWLHDSFGTNGRMTEMQAAIGRIQLRRLSDWTARRAANARRLTSALQPCAAMRVPTPPTDITHAWYKFYAFVRPENIKAGWSRDRIIKEINERGVPCYHGSCPEVYLEKAFDGTGFRPASRLPVAKSLGEQSIMFLVHPTLTDAEIEITCDVVANVMRLAQK